MFRHVYLAPHFDDASLSCGGAIHQQVQAGQPVLVVTICAAPPPANDPLSPFAEQLHQRWGNPEDVVATRQTEDQTSMRILGADYVRLDFKDCIYRGQPAQERWYYNDTAELFGQVHPEDMPLMASIIETIVRLVPHEAGMTLYAPLTVGNHVDHQLVHAAARGMQQQGWPVVFYEDYPYVDPAFLGWDNRYSLEATLNRLQQTGLHPQIRVFSEESVQVKVDSIAAYASQMDILFGGSNNMADQVRNYALQVGNGSPAERIWVLA